MKRITGVAGYYAAHVCGDDEECERAALVRSLELIVEEMGRISLPRAVRALVETDLTLQQLRILTVLVSAPQGLSTRTLAETSGVSMAAMSTMADRLVAQGVVRREVDVRDQRVRTLHATPRGRHVLQRVLAARPEFAEGTLARLALVDLRALEQGMRAVVVARAEEADAPGGS